MQGYVWWFVPGFVLLIAELTTGTFFPARGPVRGATGRGGDHRFWRVGVVVLHTMQAQITAEREKRALIASSEGRKQEQINIGGLIATAMAVVKSQGAAKSG